MAADAFVLSAADRAALVAALRRSRTEPLNPRGRPAPAVRLGTTPEVYVARAPSGGIPARIGTLPNSAECDIYRLVDFSGTKALQSAGFTRAVYNLAGVTLQGPGGTRPYFMAHRDKFGEWYAKCTPCIVSPPGTATATGTGSPFVPNLCCEAVIPDVIYFVVASDFPPFPFPTEIEAGAVLTLARSGADPAAWDSAGWNVGTGTGSGSGSTLRARFLFTPQPIGCECVPTILWTRDPDIDWNTAVEGVDYTSDKAACAMVLQNGPCDWVSENYWRLFNGSISVPGGTIVYG